MGRAALGRPLLKQSLELTLDRVRSAAVGSGAPSPDRDEILARAAALASYAATGLTSVINATGVILHTGLGRAPLSERAARAAERAALGYGDLEIERVSGARGRRTARAELMLTALTGAEAALVVNNGAAGVLLALAALARGKEVLVSRGELIEIGGEFRIPDIMAASGARLVEVGTTNRTRAGDYRARALGADRRDPQGPPVELSRRGLHGSRVPAKDSRRSRRNRRAVPVRRGLRALARTDPGVPSGRADDHRSPRRGRRPRDVQRGQAPWRA